VPPVAVEVKVMAHGAVQLVRSGTQLIESEAGSTAMLVLQVAVWDAESLTVTVAAKTPEVV
jgi:hypothetical protein